MITKNFILYSCISDPLPGGCNLEFNLELDPNLPVLIKPNIASLEFQYANVPLPTNTRRPPPVPLCENSTLQSQLTYTLYVYYMQGGDFSKESYFDAVESMMTVSQVQKHGRKVISMFLFNILNIGMHVSPASHTYAWLPRKFDCQTDTQTDRQTPDKVIPIWRYFSQTTQKCCTLMIYIHRAIMFIAGFWW